MSASYPLWPILFLPSSTNPLTAPAFRPIIPCLIAPMFGIGTVQPMSVLLGLVPCGSARLPSGVVSHTVAAVPTAPEWGTGWWRGWVWMR